ncbi:MAG: glycosyltransferase, partial [Anaerolineales bacterium]
MSGDTSDPAAHPAAALRPLHIVQIGFDDTIFQSEAPSDTLRRQQDYTQELVKQRPGSAMTVIMLTNNTAVRSIDDGSLQVLPISARSLRRWPALYALLRRLHAARPIDVIATQSIHMDAWVALWFGAWHAAPVVGQVHYDLFAPTARRDALGPGPVGALRQAISLRLLRRMAAVRAVSQGLEPKLRAAGARQVAVIPVPVTMASGPLQLPASREPLVLYVGRLVAQKNLGLWLQVAQQVALRVPYARFEIVGDGPLRQSLELEALRLGLAGRIRFTGPVAYADLDQVYGRASVFLLTSLYEGLVRVAVEAALHAMPIVATEIGGVRDIITHGETGFLAAPGDAAALAASVIRLLEDSNLRNEIGRRGQQSVRERYDPRRL